MAGPTVSIVTPIHDGKPYIRDMLQSLTCQINTDFEHIVIDGESTDGTLQILESHNPDHKFEWISEPDDGMYDAIEKGFDIASGDIYAWLNADDIYFPWTIDVVAEALYRDGVEWITGHPTISNSAGRMINIAGVRPRYRRAWIRRGWYHGRGLGFIQQESTFWTARLWDIAGGFPDGLRLAGDFYLWRQFAAEVELKTMTSALAMRRGHDGQLTADMDAYYQEVDTSDDFLPRSLRRLQLSTIYSILRGLFSEPIRPGNQ